MGLTMTKPKQRAIRGAKPRTEMLAARVLASPTDRDVRAPRLSIVQRFDALDQIARDLQAVLATEFGKRVE